MKTKNRIKLLGIFDYTYSDEGKEYGAFSVRRTQRLKGYIMKKSLKAILVIVAATAVCSFGTNASAGEWAAIFNGKDIEGWEKKGGDAVYNVESGCIVGTTKPKTPNTFLCPPKKYGDFGLTFEVKCDPALESRSNDREFGSETL